MRRVFDPSHPTIAKVVFACLLIAAAPLPAAPPVQVDAADPPEAEQGTVNLDVRVLGNGFDNGSAVDFFVTKTKDPGGVTVNGVVFVSSQELVANIDVADDAVVSPFDIQVTTTRGRRGKGTETFKVLQKGGGNPDNIVIVGTLDDEDGDDIRSDGGGSYEAVMPGAGNLVWLLDANSTRTFKVHLMDAPEKVENPCTDTPEGEPKEVCLRDGTTRVASSYDAGFLALNLTGFDCDGDPNDVVPRDMFAGECIRAYLAITFDHPNQKPRVQMRLRCGKHPHEGNDPVRLECLDALDGACVLWDARPFLDGGGSEHMTCQLYHRARKGNETDLELAEWDIAFGMTVVRQP